MKIVKNNKTVYIILIKVNKNTKKDDFKKEQKFE